MLQNLDSSKNLTNLLQSPKFKLPVHGAKFCDLLTSITIKIKTYWNFQGKETVLIWLLHVIAAGLIMSKQYHHCQKEHY